MGVLETKYVPLVRLRVVRERYLSYENDEVINPVRVAKLVKRLLEGADKECLLVIPVDAKKKPLGVEFAAMGALNLTRRMQDAGDLLGVELLDHVIVGDYGSYFSMSETHRWKMRERYTVKEKEAC